MPIVGKVKRKPGKLYYVDKSGRVHETALNRKGGKKGRRVRRPKKAKKRRTAGRRR